MKPNSHIWTSSDFGMEDIGSPSRAGFGIPAGPRYDDWHAHKAAMDMRKIYEEERRRVWEAAETAVKQHDALSQVAIQTLTDQVLVLQVVICKLETELNELYKDALSE